MRKLAGLLLLTLMGCGSLDQMSSKLDTAPIHDSELRYPEWGGVSRVEVTPHPNMDATQYVVEGPYGERKNDGVETLTSFLSRHGIPYEVVSGGHYIVKLKQKISFQPGSAYVSKSSQEWLRKLGGYLSAYSDFDIVIEGHTDSTGGVALNDKLSQSRALQVKSQLTKSDVPSGSIYTRGYGEYMPACGNDTSSGKACNRRAELMLIISSN